VRKSDTGERRKSFAFLGRLEDFTALGFGLLNPVLFSALVLNRDFSGKSQGFGTPGHEQNKSQPCGSLFHALLYRLFALTLEGGTLLAFFNP
jgi:hypothetical protein